MFRVLGKYNFGVTLKTASGNGNALFCVSANNAQNSEIGHSNFLWKTRFRIICAVLCQCLGTHAQFPKYSKQSISKRPISKSMFHELGI